MVRLDDNELNINPEVAAALSRFRPEFVDGHVEPRIRIELSEVAENPLVGFMAGGEVVGRILLWIFGAVVMVIAAVLVFSILAWLYALFATTPQQRQLGASRATGATVAHLQTYRPPRPPGPQHPRHRIGTSLHHPAHRSMPWPMSAYLPPAYDYACIPKEYLWPIRLRDRMPRSLGAEGPRTYIPRGTCLLFERQNVNGWRRVVSYDARLVGYAQLFPTSYERRPMYPLFAKLIPLIRGIP
jgi:hypothetical protein